MIPPDMKALRRNYYKTDSWLGNPHSFQPTAIRLSSQPRVTLTSANFSFPYFTR